jgi:hypothetical protein
MIRDGKHTLCDDVERTIIIRKEGKLQLTFPSLYGSDCCLARYDENQGVWEICVNPFSQTFQLRASMKMKTGSLVRIPRKRSYLDFGWRNYEFEEQDYYKRAGTTGNVLKKQVITTICPRTHARMYNAHPRARVMSFSTGKAQRPPKES